MDHCHQMYFTRFIFLWFVVILRTTDGGNVTWFEPPPVKVIADSNAIPTVNRNLTKGLEEKLSWSFSLTFDLTLITVTVAFKGSAPGSSFENVATYVQSLGKASLQPGFDDQYNVSWIPSKITLTVFSVTTENNGEFECRLLLFDGSRTATWRRKIQVTVHVPPNITSITESQIVNEGENLTLSCTADGTTPNPTITWTRLSDNKVVTNNVWTLTNISRQENGTYRCTADNGVGSPAVKDVVINVHYQPNITSISDNQKVNESDVVSLKCEADGNPTPTISWTRLSDNSTITMPLNITGKQDEGSYRCTADNGVGSPASSDVFITVQYHRPGTANVTTNLTNDTVVLNEPFNLMCRADANPPAHYRLYKQQQPLTTITDNQAVATFTTSVGERIKQVTYSCTPFNSFGAGPSDTASVTVHFSPSATTNGRNETVSLGTPITFTCPVDGNPPPSVRWSKGSEPSDTVLSSEKEFKFTPNSPSDTGLYTCFASNYLGNISVRFGLEVAAASPTSPATPATPAKPMDVHVKCTITNKDCEADIEQVKKEFPEEVYNTKRRLPHLESVKVIGTGCGSVIVDLVLRFNESVNENDVISILKDAAKNGRFGQFRVDPDSVKLIGTGREPTTGAPACKKSFFQNDDCSENWLHLILIIVAAVVLIAIIAVAVGCWIHKKRKCRKDTRIAHDPRCEEQRLQGDDRYGQVNNGYAETGPPSAKSTEKAAAAVPDYAVVDKSAKKKKKNEKVDDTYAKVDMSKKTSKKKPRPGEDVLYADLGDFNGTPQMPAVATSPKALPPIKKPDPYEGTQYADITQFLKGDAILPKNEKQDDKQATEMKEKDEKADGAGGENAPKETPM